MRLIERTLFVLSRISWAVLVIGLVVLFGISWSLMLYFEPSSPISRPDVYWWYFLVTVATVGYGDFTPATLGGRLVGAVDIFFGIGFFAAILTKMAESIIQFSQRRRKGMVQLKLNNHIVLMGYRPGKTEEIVKELKADPKTSKLAIVLCSATAPENPFATDHVDFVKGDLISSKVLEQACASRARVILIYGSDDDHTLAIGIAVSQVASPEAHVVAYFRSSESGNLLRRVNQSVDLVTSMTSAMIVQTMQDPGSSRVFQLLTSDQDQDATMYRMNIPDGVSEVKFWQIFIGFKTGYDAIVTGLAQNWSANAQVDLNPRNDSLVKGGMSIFYLANQRLVDSQVEWSSFVS